MGLNRFKLAQIYGGGAVACAAVSAALWFTLAAPSVENQRHRANLTRELISRQQEAASATAELESSRQALQKVRENLDANALRLQSASDVNQRLAAVTSLATANGLAVDALRPGEIIDATHYQRLPIHLSGSGAYPAAAKFFHQLHEQFPDTGIHSFDATNANPAGGSTKLAFQIDLVWYTKK